jgi:hypothetical protein
VNIELIDSSLLMRLMTLARDGAIDNCLIFVQLAASAVNGMVLVITNSSKVELLILLIALPDSTA